MRIVRETFRMVEGLEAVRSDLAWRKWVCDDIVADLAARAPLSRAEIDLGGRLGDLIAMLDDLAELLESSGQMPAIEETALEEIERRLPRPPKRTVRRRRTRRDAPRAPASAQRVPAHG
ncbi:MAG TPA: hypothetical protein VEL05_00425 [Candidatus Acidoferrum sp.]|nr:hypothetical protein [Candidatus Acidoferrum sp.]